MASAEGGKGGKTDNNDTNQVPGRNINESTTIELYSQLLASVKDISAQMSKSDKRITDLSNRMPQNPVTTASSSTARTNVSVNTALSTESEPLFTAPAAVGDVCGEGARLKKPQRPKNRHLSELGGATPAKNPKTCVTSGDVSHKSSGQSLSHVKVNSARPALRHTVTRPVSASVGALLQLPVLNVTTQGESELHMLHTQSHVMDVHTPHTQPHAREVQVPHTQHVTCSGTPAHTTAHTATTEHQWGAHSVLDHTHTLPWHHTHVSPAQQMQDLHSNHHVRGLAVASIANMEQAALPATRKRVSGRCNFKDPMEPNPLIRWPNENIPLADGGGRPSYDELSQAQFVSGVLATIQDITLPIFKNAIINELRQWTFLTLWGGPLLRQHLLT